MFEFHNLNGLLYVGDFLFLSALATIIIKLNLEKSNQGFSAKTQGVYGLVVCTRNIDLLFVEGSTSYLIYSISKKIVNISCIIYIVFKIKNTSKNTTTCNCNQDSFWVEALVLPCIIITAVFHYGASPEEVLWSFSTYLEAVAMVPQLYLIQVRGKGDSFLLAYIALMAIYSLADATAYCLNSFLYDKMPAVWPACKCLQLAIYIWYIFIPREPVLPVANCDQRKRRTTVFMKQQSMLAQTLLNKNNSSNDLQVFTLTSPTTSASGSICSSSGEASLEGPGFTFDTPSPPPTPCIKFDIGLEDEVITLKAPIMSTIRQLKNKGSLKLNSLPTTPQLSRRLSRSTSSIDSFKPINQFTQFETAMSQRAKRKRRNGLSLPNSPETPRKSQLPFKYPRVPMFRSVSQNNSVQTKQKRKQIRGDISLPSTPEPSRKQELVLSPSSSYLSLSHLALTRPNKFHLKRPPLPRVEGSPAFEKKSDQTLPVSPLALPVSPSPKPARPPPPKIHVPHIRTNTSQETHTDNSQSPINTQKQMDSVQTIRETDMKTSNKPKRPPLPKLIISTPETTNA